MASIKYLTPEEKTACGTLRLTGTVDAELLKKRYRELSKKTHPDVGGKTEEFTKVNTAYELLSKITPLDCTKMDSRDFEVINSWLYGEIRKETADSINRRYSKYAPDGFTRWREHVR